MRKEGKESRAPGAGDALSSLFSLPLWWPPEIIILDLWL
jgi:hypothetical protein